MLIVIQYHDNVEQSGQISIKIPLHIDLMQVVHTLIVFFVPFSLSQEAHRFELLNFWGRNSLSTYNCTKMFNEERKVIKYKQKLYNIGINVRLTVVVNVGSGDTLECWMHTSLRCISVCTCVYCTRLKT